MKLKQQIKKAINDFKSVNLFETGINLFQILGYNTQRQSKVDNRTFEGFYNDFIDGNDNIPDVEKFKDKALTSDWQSIEMLFQLTESEMSSRDSLFDTARVDNTIIEAYLFFAIELKETDYSRTKLSNITRSLNRVFPMPVMVLFKYGGYLTLSVIKRRLHKRDESRDVLKKVTLIKDIKIEDPHRAHTEILFDLSLEELRKKHAVTSFVELDKAWRKTLDSSELNKKFYKELANWYFWAVENAEFPDGAEKNREIRNASSIIRLLTRLIFVWFVKEKGLIPDKLFNKSKLDNILNYKNNNESSFYKAILQNLFFATLNQEQSKRAFRRNGQNYNVTNLYRYKKLFKIDEIKILDLFKNIPFLNGGLFECLDKPHATKKGPHGGDVIIRIDGFSDRDDNVLKVPDCLFFSEGKNVDLNEVFGTKNKKYKPIGLITLLDKYKFTIAENTPIEEEIALDPELLGKVFENLLASYNPETKTTARKQTGSFYTPREIVDYMVDESLKASLSNLVSKKIDNVSEEDIQTGLEILFAYTEKEHAFTKTEVSKVIEAVSELKILDPACGSGAFPMGILHKLVFILSKIDEHNERWKELQKQRALKETEAAYNLGSKDDRHQRLAEIEKAFDFNTSDYGRKLFLIENSIYGVDIQPIAVQIAKLRFFISLMVDQDVDKTKENLGVLPLPNLETKFVAANTLIGVDKPDQGDFADLKTKDLENELLIVRHKHFNAKTQKTKKQYREKDKKIRHKISQVLKNFGWPSDTAEMLAAWDPYDQNKFANFFDMERMFGIKDGFDIVIGNPPYVNAKALTIHFKSLREKLTNSDKYRTLYRKWDLYIPFVEKGINITRQNGIICIIIPYPFINQTYSKLLRKYILNNFTLMEIVDLSNTKVFDATILNCICIILKSKSERKISISSSENNIIKKKFLKKKEDIIIDHKNYIWDLKDTKRINIKHDKLKVIGDFAFLSIGMVLNANEKIAKGQFTKKDLISDERTNKHIKKYVEAKNLDKFEINKIRWLEWNTARVPKLIRRPTFPELYDNPKLLINKIGGIKVAFDKDNISCDQTVRILVLWKYLKGVQNKSINNSLKKFYNEPRNILEKNSENISYNYILCILNSKLGDYLLSRIRGAGNIDINPEYLKNIPIPQISLAEQHPFIKLADEIITAKKSKPLCDTTPIEVEIDAHVAHLYNLTEEEYSLILKETNCSDPFRVAALNVYRDIARGKIK